MAEQKSTQVENPRKADKQLEARIEHLEKTIKEIQKVLSIALGQINYKE